MAWPVRMHVRQACLWESKSDNAPNLAKLPPSNQIPSRYANIVNRTGVSLRIVHNFDSLPL